MSNDFGGRGSRTPTASSSMGSGVAIFVTAVALVLGFLILRKVNDSTPAAVSPGGTEQTDGTTGTGDTSVTVPLDTGPTTTAALVQVFTGTNVQVANSSVQNGVAKMMTTALLGAGFTTTEATNGTADPKLTTSKVIYNADDPTAKPVADTLAAILGGIAVEPMSIPLPVQSGSWAAGSGVILLLGNDLAGRTLEQIQGVTDTGTTQPPAG
ncbi:MAG: LytR C-terminal domain-containing protein [Actinomycetota bacterium]|nr:LytR C-terminal domain-containing protein [Actinomycetota bacterium]